MTVAKPLIYEAFKDRKHPGTWRVEAINYNCEGECFVAIFTGSDAKNRAEEYAAWRNGTLANLASPKDEETLKLLREEVAGNPKKHEGFAWVADDEKSH